MLVGTSWTFASTVVAVVVGLVSQPILVAFVGVTGYGIWASTIAIASLFSLGGDLGVASALPKLIAERKGRGEDEGTLASSSLLFALLTGGIAAGALALSAPFLGGFVNFPNFTLLLQIQALQVPFTFGLGSLLALFQGGRDFRSYAMTAIALAVTNLVLMTAFLALGAGLAGVITASLLATVGVFLMMTLLHRSRFRFSGLPVLRRDLGLLIPFGIRLSLSILLSQIMYQIDVVALSFWTKDSSVVGTYALAVFVARLLWILPGGISLTTYPAVSEYSAQRNDRRLSTYLRTALTASIAITGGLAAGIVLLGKPALRITFGADAVPAYGLCLVLLAGTASLGSVRSIAPAIPGAGRPDIAVWISAAGAAATLVLVILLTAIQGAVGTAVAVSLAFAFESAAVLWATRKFVLPVEHRKAAFRRALPVAVGAVAVCIAGIPLAAQASDSVAILIPALFWGAGFGLLLLISGGRTALKRILR